MFRPPQILNQVLPPNFKAICPPPPYVKSVGAEPMSNSVMENRKKRKIEEKSKIEKRNWKKNEKMWVRPLIFNSLSTGCIRVRFWTSDHACLHGEKEIICSFVLTLWFLISLFSLNVWIETSSWRQQTRKKEIFLLFLHKSLPIQAYSSLSIQCDCWG